MASGPLSLPMEHLKTLLSNSATFQSWVGAADAAEALASIYMVRVDEETFTRPLAVIDIGEKYYSNIRSGGGANFFQKRGELLLMFEADVVEGSTSEEAVLNFLDNVGGCLADMEELSGTPEFLSLHEIEFDEAPTRSIDDEEPPEGDFYRVKFIVTWGL